MRRGRSPSLARRAAWTTAVTARAPLEARFPFRPPEAIERAQRRRIASIVAHAYRHVPYYRETMRRLGLEPEDLRSADDLAKLPLIEREQLQRDPEYFLSRALAPGSRLPVRTGGSTGEPIVFCREPGSLLQRLVAFQRMEPVLVRLAGRRWRRRQALIAAPDSSTSAVNRVTRQHLLPTVRTVHAVFSLFTPPDELAARIEGFKPDVITGFGSAIEALFAELLAQERRGHLPSVVIYAADSLSEPMRREISALGVHVLSVYQAVEMPTIGFECEEHAGHHLNVDLCPVRILGESERELPLGERGDVVVSNLVNRGTVLLNYRLGDVAARLPGRCRCMRSLPLLSPVEGRINEWLRSGSGELVHPQTLHSFLRRVPGLLRYQLVQERPGHVRVVAVAAPEADRAAMRAVIAGEAVNVDELAVEVEFTDTLPRTEGGKVRSLVS